LTKVDSAESQLGLLQAGNGEGTLYLLIDPQTSIAKKARFLSYGKLSSILIFDAFCEHIKDKAIETYDRVDYKLLQQLLLENIDATELPFPQIDFETLDDLLKKLRANLPKMQVSAPIQNQVGAYKRKAKEDMNERDLNWLPLSAPQKIAQIEMIISKLVPERTSYLAEDLELYNVERDLNVMIRFNEKITPQHRALIIQYLSEACQAELHPEIIVSEVSS